MPDVKQFQWYSSDNDQVLRDEDVPEENDDYYDPWNSYQDLIDSAAKALMQERYND